MTRITTLRLTLSFASIFIGATFYYVLVRTTTGANELVPFTDGVEEAWVPKDVHVDIQDDLGSTVCAHVTDVKSCLADTRRLYHRHYRQHYQHWCQIYRDERNIRYPKRNRLFPIFHLLQSSPSLRYGTLHPITKNPSIFPISSLLSLPTPRLTFFSSNTTAIASVLRHASPHT